MLMPSSRFGRSRAALHDHRMIGGPHEIYLNSPADETIPELPTEIPFSINSERAL